MKTLIFDDYEKSFLALKEKGEKEGLNFSDYVQLKELCEKTQSFINSYDEEPPHDYLNNDFYSLIEEVYKKGQHGLLQLGDYTDFKQRFNAISETDIKTYFITSNVGEDFHRLNVEIEETIEKIYWSGFLNKFSKGDCNYIISHSYLLPLVLANNTHHKIRMYSDNSYMFLCQFHNECTPSFGVTDSKNLMYCFGCGVCGNPLDYLKQYENLSFKDAILLLSQIYLFDVKMQNPELEPLVEKYRNTILSDEYLNLLEMGQERLKKRNIVSLDCVDVEKIYADRYETIERIRNNEYDVNFHYEGPTKKLVYLNRCNDF